MGTLDCSPADWNVSSDMLQTKRPWAYRFSFCDVSKVFYRVWHKGLLTKLYHYGVRGELLRWIESYITGRKQRVLVNKTISGVGTVQAGVPQGSVLGPLLFLIYINDIADKINGVTRLFADDSSISSSSSDIRIIEYSLNRDLETLNKWTMWNLKII